MSETTIDWQIPAGQRTDWLVGTGATRAERGLTYGTAILGAVLTAWLWWRDGIDWAWWQVAVGLLVAADLYGGAVANSCSSTKRQYFAPLPRNAGFLDRFAHQPLAFTALHVYPFVIVALFPDGSWTWAAAWYAFVLVAVVVIERLVPQYLARPVAMLLFVAAATVSFSVPAPPGWGWFPIVFLAKLVLAHAVREEPYRPVTPSTGERPA